MSAESREFHREAAHTEPLTATLSLSLRPPPSSLLLSVSLRGTVPVGSLTLGKASRPAPSRARPSCPLRTVQHLLLRKIGLRHTSASAAAASTTLPNMHLKSMKCNRFCLIASLEDPDMFNQPQARVRCTGFTTATSGRAPVPFHSSPGRDTAESLLLLLLLLSKP